jgi:hypothetical protein
MAIGDFNNDGGIDVLVAVNDSAPVLLRNNVGNQNHWLGVKLVGKKANPDAIGAAHHLSGGGSEKKQVESWRR